MLGMLGSTEAQSHSPRRSIPMFSDECDTIWIYSEFVYEMVHLVPTLVYLGKIWATNKSKIK